MKFLFAFHMWAALERLFRLFGCSISCWDRTVTHISIRSPEEIAITLAQPESEDEKDAIFANITGMMINEMLIDGELRSMLYARVTERLAAEDFSHGEENKSELT